MEIYINIMIKIPDFSKKKKKIRICLYSASIKPNNEKFFALNVAESAS